MISSFLERIFSFPNDIFCPQVLCKTDSELKSGIVQKCPEWYKHFGWLIQSYVQSVNVGGQVWLVRTCCDYLRALSFFLFPLTCAPHWMSMLLTQLYLLIHGWLKNTQYNWKVSFLGHAYLQKKITFKKVSVLA